ncbi:hypothetical protein BDZ94DRAFT_1229713 [Collybia nuda]|uniref:Protein kinase domain-containing protein n=1 Tax=Collybia nuda TaxID=64659 RepID=A0A9P5XVQ9_9AGAR|nr:hypothetical protein BDZ94DRAFT_1229713 [Collybia nuda]
MPLRFIRVPRINTQDVLHLATSATVLTRELSAMSGFPPAVAAVSIVLLIFETIQVSTLSDLGDIFLARRCARILLDINLQMEGRWDSAPLSLLKNLERFQLTLTSIHAFMKIQCDAKWSRRFMQKTSIENALMDFTSQVNDTAQSFQVAALIDIHYAVSSISGGWRKSAGESDSPSRITFSSSPSTSPPPTYAITQGMAEARNGSSLYTVASPTETDHSDKRFDGTNHSGLMETGEGYSIENIPEESALELDNYGSRRYHQSEVRLKGKSRLRGGWWEGASVAEVNGQVSLIKRYEGTHAEATKSWLDDVRSLQNLRHPNLPQMVGFSAERAPTPFILLSNVQTRTPQALLLDTVVSRGLATGITLLLHFYQDVTDATSYVQRQLGLEDHRAQDFIGEAHYRISASGSIVMGLPYHRGRWVTVRSFNLTESLTGVVMSMLPRGNLVEYKRIDRLEEDETRRKITHLVALARGLLPTKNDPPELSPRVKALLSSDGGADLQYSQPKLTLRQVRLSNIEAKTHEHAWNENSCVQAHKFSVGDFGYVPKGKDFDEFIVLGNVFKDELAFFPTESRASGSQWCWKDLPIKRTEITPVSLPGNVKCWAITVPHGAQMDCQIIQYNTISNVSDAWQFFLHNCRFLADEFNIKPEDLMFITRAGTDQHDYIRDFRSGLQHPGFRHPIHEPFVHNQQRFSHQTTDVHHFSGRFEQHNSVPTVLYLMTSQDSEYNTYWTHEPIAVAKGISPPLLQSGWTYQIGWCTGFVSWIQLHSEDFLD